MAELLWLAYRGSEGVVSRSILREELRGLGLSVGYDETDARLAEAIPVPLAQRLRVALEGRGVECSWAPDHNDGELAWVYVTVA